MDKNDCKYDKESCGHADDCGYRSVCGKTFFILDRSNGKVTVKLMDFMEFLYEHLPVSGAFDNRLMLTHIQGVKVSTVLLPTGSALEPNALCFETVVFGGEFNGARVGFKSLEQARMGHVEAVKIVLEGTAL